VVLGTLRAARASAPDPLWEELFAAEKACIIRLLEHFRVAQNQLI
jgi:hypothetical protein